MMKDLKTRPLKTKMFQENEHYNVKIRLIVFVVYVPIIRNKTTLSMI